MVGLASLGELLALVIRGGLGSDSMADLRRFSAPVEIESLVSPTLGPLFDPGFRRGVIDLSRRQCSDRQAQRDQQPARLLSMEGD